MSSDITEVTCRLATPADYEGVMNINRNVYAGYDYMPVMYQRYIADPQRVLAVALRNGSIVGFEMLFVVDDNRTIVHQAGRVKPELNGQGINSQINSFLERVIQERFPHLEKRIWTTINRTATEKMLKKNPGILKIAAVRPRLSCDFEAGSLNQLVRGDAFKAVCDKYDVTEVRRLGPTEAESLLQTQHVCSMSPDGYWILGFEPMSALACNAGIIARSLCAAVFVSQDPSSGEPTAISFGSAVRIPIGLKHRMDFYVHPRYVRQSSRLYIAHFMKHLMYVNQFCKTYISMSGLFSDTFDSTEAHDVLFKQLHLSKPAAADTGAPCLLLQYSGVGNPVFNAKAKL